ncbi:sodium/solute symporter [Segatella bryantii]|uniref:sodium:solute symporter family transporter n=1 Tax=Segatella bryantii TaxID=77095 RepID=UPI001EDC7D13|nr:sodium/solute symporter [Segatella bryantii]UKK73281.1 sodium/solute symporter [Segatella bryantii]
MNNISEALASSGFKPIDFIILVIYLCLLVGLGLFLSRNKDGKEKTANDYFLAGNTLTWWAVGASLIAANISAEQFIGMSGTGYADGIAIAAYEVMAAVTLVVIGKFLLPVMLDRKIFTIPQFLRERYNDGVGLAFSILWLFLYVFVNLTSVAWLGALAIEQILGLQGISVEVMGMTISVRMIIILFLFIIAGVYSIYGGLASVAWTDVMQVTFLVGGGLITAYIALKEMGVALGTDTLSAFSQMYHDLTTGTHINDTHFHLIIQESHNGSAFANVPGIAAVVGGVWLTNLGYWGFNQYIIQKGLAAKNIEEAKKGLVFAGFLKILIPFIVVIPGICAYYILKGNPDAFTAMSLHGKVNVSDDAYPWLIRNFTPTGIKGLSFAALAAAIISSLASMFNSTSTLFTMDIYKKYINKEASDKTLVNVGRTVSICALVIAAVAVKPLLGGLDQAFQYIQEYSGFIYPGIITVFGLGLLWKRASSKAAIWTAVLTIPMGVLFKVTLPQVAFQLRAGYVFMILVTFFFLVSYFDNKYVSVELPSEDDQAKMKMWAKVLGGIGLLMIIAAAIVTIGGALNPNADPNNNLLAYLNDIGFQAFFFFGVLVGQCAIWLNSNAKDKVKDVKALDVNLSLFATSRSYTYGTIGIVAITFLLYALLW